MFCSFSVNCCKDSPFGGAASFKMQKCNKIVRNNKPLLIISIFFLLAVVFFLFEPVDLNVAPFFFCLTDVHGWNSHFVYRNIFFLTNTSSKPCMSSFYSALLTSEK